MHFSIFTSQKPPPTPSDGAKGFFALMPLADACALLRRGELDILHILRYKYPGDVYCTHKGSGAKLLGSHLILLSLFIVVVREVSHFWGGLLRLCVGTQSERGLQGSLK